MKRLLSLFLTLAGLSASAFAQISGDGVFQKFDKNADGKVTSEELPNQQAFERFATNQDGATTLEESEAVPGGAIPKPSTAEMPAKPGKCPPSSPIPFSPATTRTAMAR